MASKQKPFTDEEKTALEKAGLKWQYWESVWRGTNTFIVRRIGGYEMRTIEKHQIPS